MTLVQTAPLPARAPAGPLPELPARRRPAPPAASAGGQAARPAVGPPGRLDGRIALISGAAGDLGAALVRRYAAEGAAVFVSDLDADRSRWLAEQVCAEQPLARVVGGGLDVTRADDWTRAMRLARRHLGPVDVLVNNAGLIDLDRLDSLDPDSWSRTVAVNQTAVMTGMRAVLPTMWQAGGGSIVNVGSVFGLVGTGGCFAYHATKGALQAMTTAAAVELAPRRIRVNAVLPGLIKTQMTDTLPAEFVADYLAATPLARLAGCHDVAAAAVFLASDEADFVTGVCLPVDGGYTSR